MRHEWTDPDTDSRCVAEGDPKNGHPVLSINGHSMPNAIIAREIVRQAARIRELEEIVYGSATGQPKTWAARFMEERRKVADLERRILGLEAENRQLRERAEAAELRATINADALKAEIRGSR